MIPSNAVYPLHGRIIGSTSLELPAATMTAPIFKTLHHHSDCAIPSICLLAILAKKRYLAKSVLFDEQAFKAEAAILFKSE